MIKDQKKVLIHDCRVQVVRYSLNQDRRSLVTMSFNDWNNGKVLKTLISFANIHKDY